jgi:hypothetical protein
MITQEQIKDLMSPLVVTSEAPDGGIRVSTHVLYPSNGAVSVVVRGGKNSFQVSDEGEGVEAIISSGIKATLTDRAIKAQLRMTGLHVREGVIFTPMVPLEAIPAAVMLVANASRKIADWGLSHLPFTSNRNFKSDLAQLLDKYFHDRLRNDEVVVGESNKAHKFGHAIYLGGERKLLIDPVINDASSINSRVVANMDVKMAANPLIDQLIVYDDSLHWKSSDLKLLELGARTVAFSYARPFLEQVRANG